MRKISLTELRNLTGTEVGASAWHTIPQERIDNFARITGDDQFIHVDPVRAGVSKFGGTIVHGFLTLSLLPVMIDEAVPEIENVEMRINYGFNRLRFISPVLADSEIRGYFELQSVVETSASEATVIWNVRMDTKSSDKPALMAEWVHRFFLKR